MQNGIFEILGGMITKTILAAAAVSEARFFAVISDEIEDASSTEIIIFVLKYVHKEGDLYVVKESFVGFYEQHREMTGDDIASTII